MSNKMQILLRGLWMSAILWPYAHSGGFHYAAILSLSPLWLALGDLWAPRLLRWATAFAVLFAELILEWSAFPSVRHVFRTFSRSVIVLHHLSFTNWNQISAHIATPLLLIAAWIGWQVYRRTTTARRISALMIIGIMALAINHVFWRLPAAVPLFAYAATGLLLLSYNRVLNHLPYQSGTRRTGLAITVASVMLALGIGWSLSPQPGHSSLGWLGGQFQDLRFLGATGATTGFSGGINHIGHSVVPDYQPVMVVHSLSPHYWQAEIYNTFTGKEWTDAEQNAIQITPEDSGIPLFGLPFNNASVQTSTVTVQMQALNGHSFHTLFYPGVPLSFSHESSLVLYPNKEQFVSSALTRYQVTSMIPHFTSHQLNQVFFGEYAVRGLNDDLQMPRNLSPKVSALAHKVTAQARGPWQAALDLKSYLDTHYRYSFVVTPTRTDVVNHFLFKNKVGYCDQFSTSFIMMARSLGIPARWVVGYAPGTYSAQDHGYLIRAVDAHSWAQIYIAPYGWVPIDPTPGYQIPGTVSNSSQSSAALSTGTAPASLPKAPSTIAPQLKSHLTGKNPLQGNASTTHQSGAPSSNKTPWLTILAVAATLLAGAIFTVTRIDKTRAARHFSSRRATPSRVWGHIKWWNRWRGHIAPNSLTPREWARDWSVNVPASGPDAFELAALLEEGLFSPHGWDTLQTRRALQLWSHLRWSYFRKRPQHAS